MRTDRSAGSLDVFLRPSQSPTFSGKAGPDVEGSSAGRKGGGGKTSLVTNEEKRRTGAVGNTGATVRGTKGSGRREVVATGDDSESDDNGSRGDQEDDGAVACVCPDDRGLDKSFREEREEGDSSPEKREVEDREMLAEDTEILRGASLGGDKRDRRERLKRVKSGGKRVSKPFAGVGKSGTSCDCCGGKLPGGDGEGSVVLLDDVDGAGTPWLGDGVDGVSSQGTPSDVEASAKAQQQQHKRPETFVDTDCKYHSVRSLVVDFKAQVCSNHVLSGFDDQPEGCAM